MKHKTTCDICGLEQILIEEAKKTRLACIQAIQRRLDASEDIDGYVEGLESAIHIIEELGAIKHSINVDGSCNLGCC